MNALSQALYNLLSGDTTLAGCLSVYNGKAAVFSAEPIPLDAALPWIVWAGALHDTAFGGKVESEMGRQIHLDIRAYTAARRNDQAQSASSVLIDNICERVRALLHNQYLAVSGYSNVLTRCVDGPRQIPSDAGVMGRVLTFEFFLN